MDYLDKYLDLPGQNRQRRRPFEVVDKALEDANLSEIRQRPAGVRDQNLSAALQTLGLGATIWVYTNVWGTICDNQELFTNIVQVPSKFIMEHWDEISLAISIEDAVGFENILAFGFNLARFSIENPDLLLDVGEAIGIGLEVAGVGADLADAASTLGLSLALSAGVTLIARSVNGDKEERLKLLAQQNRKANALAIGLKKGLPPFKAKQQLAQLERQRWALV